jgi:CheY-like chemotaxis protein
MASIDLSKQSFLIVDDVRVTRISMMKLLKNSGNPSSFNAENGHEAISLLQNYSDKISCIITDFNMPVMHGLQMTKHIRTGYNNIPRNIPIIIVTGHGDRNLLGVALALDVNAFLLKPVKKQLLLERINRVLTEKEKGDSWLKPVESYNCIDVDSSIRELLSKPILETDDTITDKSQVEKAVSQHQARKRVEAQLKPERTIVSAEEPEILKIETVGDKTIKHILCTLSNIPRNSELARDLLGSNGKKLLSAGATLSYNMIARLRDIRDMGEPVNQLEVKVEELKKA